MKKIVLASGSSRRSRILNECGIRHEIIVSDVLESCPDGMDISCIVVSNASEKARSVAAGLSSAVVIGADTLVGHNDDIIGKPADKYEAMELLRRFSGSYIEVYTGLCVVDTAAGERITGFEKSDIRVADIPDNRFERYLDLLAPYDKAGGFSIEGVGALIFDNVRGSYFNILGLPMGRLSVLFAEIGLDILDFVI